MKKNIVLYNTTIFLLVIVIITVLSFKYEIGYNLPLSSKIVSWLVEDEYTHLKENKEIIHLDNITVFHNGCSEIYLDNVRKTVIDVDNKINKILGDNCNESLDIVILDTKKEFDQEFNNDDSVDIDWEGIYFNKSIYYYIENTFVEDTLSHEYAHYRFDSFCRGNDVDYYDIPLWFNEGLSEYISSLTYESFNETRDDLEVFLPINELDDILEVADNEFSVIDAYNESYLIINTLIEIKGQEIIKKILLDSKKNDFDTSFESNIGLSIEEFEDIIINN